jgi:hypothetical protein
VQLSDLEVPDFPDLDAVFDNAPDWVSGGEAAEVVPFRRPQPKAKAKPDPIAKAIQPARRKPKTKAAAAADLADVLMQAIRLARSRRGRVTRETAAREAALLDVLRELIGGDQ